MMFKKFLVTLSLCVAVLGSGCDPVLNIIDHVSFIPSPTLESVQVALVFSNSIQSDLSGSFAIDNYGYLFLNPYTPSEPFEIGFSLATNIVNDQNYVKITPTQVLPNGLPLGTPYPLVQLQGDKPVSSQF